jgi:hypothetical protein
LQGGADIAYRGDITDLQRFAGQQGGSDNGKGGVLRAGNAHLTAQWTIAGDQ